MIAVVDGVAFFLTPKAAFTSVQMALRKYRQRHKRNVPIEDVLDLPGIGFVRHPIDRLVSCYHNKIIGHHCTLHRQGFSADMSWTDFVDKVVATPDESADKHFRSQHWHMCHAGRLVPSTIIHFESLTAGWKGIDLPLPALGHLNTSDHGPWQDYFDARLLDRYARDFELFNYEV